MKPGFPRPGKLPRAEEPASGPTANFNSAVTGPRKQNGTKIEYGEDATLEAVSHNANIVRAEQGR